MLGNIYRLHAIILSRSPFLAHLMSTSPQGGGQRTIVVHLEHEPEVTHEVSLGNRPPLIQFILLNTFPYIVLQGFAIGESPLNDKYCVPYTDPLMAFLFPRSIALGYLYSAESLNMLRPENARAVLAAARLLGGMDELCGHAYEICRQSITVENIAEWLEFVEAIPAPSDGASTPIEPHQMPPSKTAVFGPYAQRLRDDVWHFLVVRLPRILNATGLSTPVTPHADSAPADTGRDALLQVYSRVPFELFKAAVESPTFEIGAFRPCSAVVCRKSV